MLRKKQITPVNYSKCNQTVTIYHRTQENGTESFTRTVIERAFFDFKKVVNVEKNGQQEANGFLLVIPYMATTGEQPVYAGDKVLLGIGPVINTREEWAAFIPAKVPNMAVVKYVDPKYWRGVIAHWEAGG